MLDREQLETFATVAEVQSFERAATLLHITRGAVSQRIKALEECRRRSNIDPPCRFNIDPGMDADRMRVSCG